MKTNRSQSQPKVYVTSSKTMTTKTTARSIKQVIPQHQNPKNNINMHERNLLCEKILALLSIAIFTWTSGKLPIVNKIQESIQWADRRCQI